MREHKQHNDLFCAIFATATFAFAIAAPTAIAGDWDNQAKDCLKAFGEPEKTEEKS